MSLTAPGALLGRAEEWKRLADALDEVRRGSLRAAFVHGEAGIGKTRLVQELIERAGHSGFALFSGRSEDLERMRPFGAIADGVENFVRGTDDPRAQALRDVLRDAAHSSNAVDVIDGFVEFVEELAVGRPVCVVLEDLHWADAETVAAARALTRRLAYLPILFLGTFRPHPQLAGLERFVDVAAREGAAVVELRRLDDDAISAMVGAIVGGTLGRRLSTMLEAAAGNPLYAAELARALQEGRALRIDDGVVDATVTELPPTLRLTILRRLSQFPADVLEVLKHAAVLGSAFQLHELAAISSDSVPAVSQRLTGPIAAKIVEERDAKLAFRHDLIHEAIYQDIPLPIRASMHVDAARVLRSGGVPLVRVAEHMIRGLDLGDPSLLDETVGLIDEVRFRAPALALRLADKLFSIPGVSQERGDEVRRIMVWALVMTGHREDARRLARELLERPQDPAAEGLIRIAAAAALAEGGRAREAADEMEQFVDKAKDLPYVDAIIRLSLAGVLIRACLLDQVPPIESLIVRAQETENPIAHTVANGLMLAWLLVKGRVAEAVTQTERYMELEAAARSMVPTPYAVPALVYQAADRFADAHRGCRDGRAHAFEVGELAALSVYSALEAWIAFFEGAWGDAVAEGERSLDLIEHQNGSPIFAVMTHATLAQVALRRGDLERARGHLGESRRWRDEVGPQWGQDLLAWTDSLLVETSGDLTRAFEVLRTGWRRSAGAHHPFGRPVFPDLVRLAVACGDHVYAASVTEEAEESLRHCEGLPSVVGMALRCRGLLIDDAKMLVAAVDAYRQSPRIVETAAACEDAASSLIRGGNSTDARALFEESLAAFDRMGATRDSNRVVAAMRSAGLRRGSRAPRRRAVTGWEALTPTEVEVARLMVEGLTNPKIAERLFVSKYTVQTHLSHVFAKLGISSRVALAGIAGERFRPAGGS